MSLELPSQRIDNQHQLTDFMHPSRKLASRNSISRNQSPERLAQLTALEMAVATGQVTLENMSVTIDLI